MRFSRAVGNVAVLVLAFGIAGAGAAQEEQQRQPRASQDAGVIPDPGAGEVFVFGEDEAGREAAAYDPQDWGRDRYGTYYETYYWQTADDGFESWYGEAGEDWRDLF